MLKTKSGLPKHCSWNHDRHGKRRVRFRHGGFSTYIAGTPWSEDFMRAYAAALDGQKERAANIIAERTIPGSFNALAVSYYRSPEFRSLKPISQRNRRNVIERFRSEHGDDPLVRLRRDHIQGLIEARSATPAAANVLLKTLHMLLNYAVFVGMIPHNPAMGVRGYRSKGDGHHTWTENEVAQYIERHPFGTKAWLALALPLFTGQRLGDVAHMGWQHVRGDAIAVRQEKTDTPLVIPLHPDLARALAMVSRTNLALIATERGLPFTVGGLGNYFRQRCNEAGLRQCSMHGLRKLAATRLANAGCTFDQVKAITGHKSASEVLRYTRAADQERLARQAIAIQIKAEQDLSNPSIPVGQKAR
jgi:integrase